MVFGCNVFPGRNCCGRHFLNRGRQCYGFLAVILWPSLSTLWPLLSRFMAVIFVAVIVMICGRQWSLSWCVAIIVMMCGHHCHCLWPSLSWFVAVSDHCHDVWPSLSWCVAIIVMVCGRNCHGLWPSLSWCIVLLSVIIVIVCGRHCHCLWPSLFVAVILCGRRCIGRVCVDRLTRVPCCHASRDADTDVASLSWLCCPLLMM